MQKEESSLPELKIHEWGAVFVVVISLATAALFSFLRPLESPPWAFLEPKLIEVEIKGAVEKTTVLQVPAGTYFRDVIQQISFHPNADLEAILDRELKKDGQVVRVPKQKKRKVPVAENKEA